LPLVSVFTAVSFAGNTWGAYRWERSTSLFNLNLGDNVDSNWDGHLLSASADWSVSTVINTTIVTGSSNPRRCKAQTGNV